MALQYLKIPISLKDHFTMPFQGTLCLIFPRFAIYIKKVPWRIRSASGGSIIATSEANNGLCEWVRLLAKLGLEHYDDAQAPVKTKKKQVPCYHGASLPLHCATTAMTHKQNL